MNPTDSRHSHKILIVGDSRLRNLSFLLNSTSLNFFFEVICLPGARIEEIGLKIMTSISYNDSFDMVLLIGGINDITRLKFRPSRHATLRYSTSSETCDKIMARLYETRDKLANILDIPVYIATIPGMNLISYSPSIWYRLLPLQGILDTAMFEINRRIRGLNRKYEQRTLNLAYPIHRCAGKGGRYYSHYSWLIDGLHPNHQLKQKWANEIISFCARNLRGVFHVQERIHDQGIN